MNNKQVLEQNLLIKSQEFITDEALEYFLAASEGIQSDDANIIDLSEKITLDCRTQYQKALKIHDFVADNIFYDYDEISGRSIRRDQSAVAVLSSRVGVCEGYANLFVAICRASGLPARKVYGVAFDDYCKDYPMEQALNHAWAEVFVDGRWVVTDPTWDTDNRYEYGRYIQRKGCNSHLYFDITIEGLSMKHLITQNNFYNKLYLYMNYSQFNKNGQEWIDWDYGISPMIIDNRTFIPLRAVIESMGGQVSFYKDDSGYDKIRIFLADHDVQMWVNYGKYYVDGIEYNFSSLPQILNGRTMIPLRSVLEPIGCKIEWDEYADNWHGRVTIGYIN